MSHDLKNYTTSAQEIQDKLDIFMHLYKEHHNVFGNLADFQEKILLDEKICEIANWIYTLLSKNSLRLVVG